jgi:hypothetical protein
MKCGGLRCPGHLSHIPCTLTTPSHPLSGWGLAKSSRLGAIRGSSLKGMNLGKHSMVRHLVRVSMSVMVATITAVGCGDDSDGGGNGSNNAGAPSDDGGDAGATSGGSNGGRSTQATGGASGGRSSQATGGTSASGGRSSPASGGRSTGESGAGGAEATGGRSAQTTGGRSGDTATGGTGSPSGGRGGQAAAGQSGSATTGGEAGSDGGAGPLPAGTPDEPAVAREGTYFGFDEQFNRYYTDPAWEPSRTIYVSPDGGGSGSTADDPTSVEDAMSQAEPGLRIVFTRGTYAGCYELDSSRSGTYDSPVVLYAERAADGSPGVTINCCDANRQTCINLEGADYVAVDGFELVGGYYGVRAVGQDLAANGHQKGVAVLHCVGHDQYRDPFFTGQSDWYVLEHSVAHDTGEGDGHGIYLSNGSDWNIARYNETYNTVSSDFQINADPFMGCEDEGIAFDDPECDAVAGTSDTGGRGVSDYMLVEGNFFHHSLAQGPNFTSVRNSVVRNNIIAFPARHGISFWQETDNPRLGSSHNVIAHNLMVTSVDNRQAIGFSNNSTDNRFENNVIAAVSIDGGTAGPNDGGQLLVTDATTVAANTFVHNAWISGFFGSDDDAEPYSPNQTELRETDFDPGWFADFPTSLGHDPAALKPSTSAPWLDLGDLLSEVPTDREGTERTQPTDLGPYER